MAAILLGLSQLAYTRHVTFAAGASLAVLGLGLSAMYLKGVTHDHALDQALNGAVLLPILLYSCLLGTHWSWLASVTAGTLGLDLVAFLVHGPHHTQGIAVLTYVSVYTLGTATVAFLVSVAHRRVLGYAEAEALCAQQRGVELQMAEARVRAILDAIPNPIFAKDRELRYIDCNAAFCAVLGLPRERILNRTVSELVAGPASEIYATADQELLKHGGNQTYETQVRFADGGDRPVVFHKAVVRDAAGQPAGLVGIFFDLSEDRRLQERLLQAEKLEALGRLAGGVAHDMNNQLVGILGTSELLARRLPPGSDRDEVQAIVTSAMRAADLPRQLLAFARKGNYLSVPVDLHQLVADTCSMLARSIGPGITIERRLEATSAMVLGDPGQLQSLILNLALNARDAMPGGGGLGFRSALVVLPDADLGDYAAGLEAGRYLLLEVSDTGQGMDASVQRRLFEPFFTTKPSGAGTGLGLASVYGAVRNHRGGIGIRSAPGQGSSFTVLLPSAASAPTPVEQRVPAVFVRRRMLVIDDDDIVRSVVTAQLTHLGHDPIPCAGGQEAIALIERGEQVDGAVIDLLMPGMSGQETFHRLRALRPDLLVIISSGHHDDHEAQALLDAGAKAFVLKPIVLADLSAILGSG